MAKQMTTEALGHYTGEGYSQKFSRRKALIGAGAFIATATFGGGTALGISKLTSKEGGVQGPDPETNNFVAGEPTQESAQNSNVESVSEGDAIVSGNNLVRNPNLYADREDQDPDTFREIADRSPAELQERFSLATETTTPDEYPAEFTSLFGAALNLGCTGLEIEPYLMLDKDAADQSYAERLYLAKMDSKYTYPVFISLFRDMDRQKAELNPTYQLFKEARHAIGSRFLRHARATGNLNEIAAVVMTEHGEPSKKESGDFAVEIGLSITNDVGDNDPTKDIYTAQGIIKAGVTIEKDYPDRLSTILVHYEPYIEVFNELSDIS